MSKRIKDSYAQQQKRKKAAKLAKKKLIINAISVIDKLSRESQRENSDFTTDDRRQIDSARYDLQSVLSGWNVRSRR